MQGKAFPDYSEKEFGISEKLAIKALVKASGISESELVSKWKKLGDLGLVAEEVIKNKKQGTLFSQELITKKVLDNLRKLPELVGKGTVNQKLALISELLTSAHSLEAKYIPTRTISPPRPCHRLRDSDNNNHPYIAAAIGWIKRVKEER